MGEQNGPMVRVAGRRIGVSFGLPEQMARSAVDVVAEPAIGSP